ncbi:MULTISPECIES: ACP S-malonyltransferase [Virgibacillus]|uniref:[acyl-carrier-protein] S-malonyltransferase n=1 Tax=Virgibacillus chiguensis TaxID=411959 RepID=A0A1M5X9J9_9BACI|nr:MULTISPECIES: ACP S-malonyltransferase [Virgibacillus]SHH96471.1 [acyl-carrier-protein] S-malonyltransferase [Virgibacillus chiguensis]
MKTAIVFPGQGSQYTNMGRFLYENHKIARRLYDEASEILGYNLLVACENKSGELNDTNITQPAILVYSIASWEIFKELNQVEEIYFSGHSLGELTAAVCGEAISFSEAVQLVQLRAKLMSQCGADGGMMVCFGLNYTEVESICKEVSTNNNHVTIANYNMKDQLVLSGHQDALHRVAEILNGQGAVTKKLDVSVPAHSQLMQPAKDGFREALRKIQKKDSKYPIYSCITGEPYLHSNDIVNQLSEQLTEGVQWPVVMDKLIREGISHFIEIGPKTVLTKIIEAEYPNVFVSPYNEINGYHTLFHSEAQSYSMNDIISFLQASLRIIVGTPIKIKIEQSKFEKEIHAPFIELRQELGKLKKNNRPQIDSIYSKKLSNQFFSILFNKGFNREETVDLLKSSIRDKNILARIHKLYI